MVSQVPGSRFQGAWGLGALLCSHCLQASVLSPSSWLSSFIQSAIQAVFTNVFSRCLPPVFPADWPSEGSDGRIGLEWAPLILLVYELKGILKNEG